MGLAFLSCLGTSQGQLLAGVENQGLGELRPLGTHPAELFSCSYVSCVTGGVSKYCRHRNAAVGGKAVALLAPASGGSSYPGGTPGRALPPPESLRRSAQLWTGSTGQPRFPGFQVGCLFPLEGLEVKLGTFCAPSRGSCRAPGPPQLLPRHCNPQPASIHMSAQQEFEASVKLPSPSSAGWRRDPSVPPAGRFQEQRLEEPFVRLPWACCAQEWLLRQGSAPVTSSRSLSAADPFSLALTAIALAC